MSFWDKIKPHKDLLGFSTAIVLATIGVVTFFATKHEVQSLQCQLSKFIQLNQDMIWMNKSQSDIESLEEKIREIKKKIKPGEDLTQIEADFLHKQQKERDELLTQYQDFVQRVQNLKKITQNMTLTGKCPE